MDPKQTLTEVENLVGGDRAIDERQIRAAILKLAMVLESLLNTPVPDHSHDVSTLAEKTEVAAIQAQLDQLKTQVGS